MSNSRITVVDNFYHYSEDGVGPLALVPRYSRPLKSDEQVYIRMLKVTSEWQPLDRGWVERASLLILENKEGMSYEINPSHEDRKADKQKIVLLGLASGDYAEDFLEIQPGEHVKITPTQLDRLRIRCLHKEARVLMHLVPE